MAANTHSQSTVGELKAEGQRQRAIFDSAIDFAIIATDREGKITDWSAGAERVLKWSVEEMHGQPVDRFFTPEDRASGRPATEMRLSLKDGRAADERWHLRKSGERFWASGEMMPLRDDSGLHIGFVKILRDRTREHRDGETLRSTEAQLRESEDHFRHTVELNPQVTWAADPQGNITSYSNRWLELTGQKPGEPDGAGWIKTLHADDIEPTMAVFSSCLASGEPVDVDYRVWAAPSQEYRWMRARAYPRRDNQGRIVRWYGVVEDEHDRKAAEIALRESEEQFRVFAQAVPNHLWASRPNGELYWFNEQVYTYAGVRHGTLDGFSWADIVHPIDLPAASMAWVRSLESGDVYETEFRIRRADGLYRWFLVRAEPVRSQGGSIIRWIGTNTDINERKLAETAATRQYERAWNLSPVLKMVVTRDDTFLAINPGFTQVLGWSIDELEGRPIADLLDVEDRAASEARRKRLAEGESLPEYQVWFLTRDGRRRRIAWTTVVEDDSLYAFGRDVTVEHEQAEALAKSEEALRQSQKMEAVGQLTGGLAHDFNNLLAGISGSLELMQARMSQGRFTEIDRYMGAAQGAAKRAAALTHRLLAFSRRQTLDPRPTDVNRLIAGMDELVRRTVGPAIDVEVVAAGGLWATLIDPPQLENALLNLCINARDAMPDGGRLTIETGNRWLDQRAAAERDLSPGQYVSLCVSDTGVGMTPDVIAKAFDPFFTTKPLGQGTGLGLSMIYGFARQSGGQVRIYSEIGTGSMVCIYLPRLVGEAEVAQPVPELSDAPRAQAGETVLIVDDEPTVRMLVTEVLQELGYAAIEASDAPSGLKVLQSDTRIDLLVTDVGLPGGMNGRQMADTARVARPDLKVLFITGYAENAAVGNGHLDPGMAVLTKPFAMEALASRIQEMILRPPPPRP